MMQGTIERTRGSLALGPNRKLAVIFRKKNALTTPSDRSGNRQPCALPENEGQDIARMRSERDANPDPLVRRETENAMTA
jgi:hypothetical protein